MVSLVDESWNCAVALGKAGSEPQDPRCRHHNNWRILSQGSLMVRGSTRVYKGSAGFNMAPLGRAHNCPLWHYVGVASSNRSSELGWVCDGGATVTEDKVGMWK